MIPRLDDFIEIASALNNALPSYDLSNMVVEFSLSKGMLQKVNEELFFRNNQGSIVQGKPLPADEVSINVGNITFRCVEKENGDQ